MLHNKLKSFWNKWSPLLVGLTLLTAFWQFRYPLYSAYIGQRYFEYESLNIYAADVLALAVVLGTMAFGQRYTRWDRVVVLWGLAILSWMTVSLLWAAAWLPAVVRAAEFWLWALFACLAAKLILRGAAWIVGGIVASGAVGVAQYLLNHSVGLQFFGESILKPNEAGMPVVLDEGRRQLRASGLAPHPNILGGVVVWGWHWLWVRLVRVGNSSRVYMAISALLGVVLVLSWTRSAWIAAAVTGLLVGIWAWRNKAKQFTGALVAALVAVALVLVSQSNVLQARLWLGEPVSLEQNSIDDRVASIEGWKEVIQGNWLVGVGAGNYPTVLAALHPDWPEWDIYPVHNIYLLWVAELGLVGLLLAGGFIWAVIRHVRTRQVGMLRILPLLGWLIMGLFDHWPLSIHQGYVGLFLALALIFAESDVS